MKRNTLPCSASSRLFSASTTAAGGLVMVADSTIGLAGRSTSVTATSRKVCPRPDDDEAPHREPSPGVPGGGAWLLPRRSRLGRRRPRGRAGTGRVRRGDVLEVAVAPGQLG